MNHFLKGVARALCASFVLPEPILEIGSYQVEGQEDLINLRGLFAGQEYIGLDLRPGPGVDLVGNVEKLDLLDGSVGTVIAFSTFEHVQRFWLGFEEVHRVLRPDGVFLVACPFYFRFHAFPNDYWRFTPPALDLLLDKYPTRILGWHGPEQRPANVWAAAFREEAQTPTPDQYARYCTLLGQYAHEPLSWTRQWRYRLGQLLCGRRPFAPFLDHNVWHTEMRRAERPRYLLPRPSEAEEPFLAWKESA
ncbi:MAG: methyltransferase domain-containing protein [Gemmataceae bacterium]